MTKFVNKHCYVMIRNNYECYNKNNDKHFLWDGVWKLFFKVFELYEYPHHMNVIIIKSNKAGESHNLSLYYRAGRKPYLIKYFDNIMIYHYITGGRRNSYLIKYADNIMIYHYITGGRRNSYLIKYSDNIMIYHYIAGGRRNSYLIKYNIMIYHYITGGRRNSY